MGRPDSWSKSTGQWQMPLLMTQLTCVEWSKSLSRNRAGVKAAQEKSYEVVPVRDGAKTCREHFDKVFQICSCVTAFSVCCWELIYHDVLLELKMYIIFNVNFN